eukprot:8970732-Pyramimonas_sp.AAC.1
MSRRIIGAPPSADDNRVVPEPLAAAPAWPWLAAVRADHGQSPASRTPRLPRECATLRARAVAEPDWPWGVKMIDEGCGVFLDAPNIT